MSFLDSLFEESSSTNSSSTLNAYGPAKGYIDSLIHQFGNLPAMQAYGDPYAAGINPNLSGAIGAGYGYGQQLMGQGQGLYDQGAGALGAGLGGYQDALSAYQNSGPAQFRFDQGTFDQIMNNAMPGLQSAVDMNGRLTTRQLGSDLAQLRAAGGLGGNTLVKRDSALAKAAAAERADNFAINAWESAFNPAISGAMSAGQQNLAGRANYDANVLGGYGQLSSIGSGLIGQGANMGIAGLGQMYNSGQLQQNLDQFGVDMARQQFMDQQTIPYQDQMNRMDILSKIGAQFGTTNSNSNTTYTPSTMNQLGSLAQTGMNLYTGGMNAFGGGGSGFGGFNPFSSTPSMGGMMTPTYGASGNSWNWDSVYGYGG